MRQERHRYGEELEMEKREAGEKKPK